MERVKKEWKEVLKDKVEVMNKEMNNYPKGCQKEWEENRVTIIKMRREAYELKKEAEKKTGKGEQKLERRHKGPYRRI